MSDRLILHKCSGHRYHSRLEKNVPLVGFCCVTLWNSFFSSTFQKVVLLEIPAFIRVSFNMPECAEDLEGLAFPVSEDFCYGKIMRCGLFIMKSPWSVSGFFFF